MHCHGCLLEHKPPPQHPVASAPTSRDLPLMPLAVHYQSKLLWARSCGNVMPAAVKFPRPTLKFIQSAALRAAMYNLRTYCSAGNNVRRPLRHLPRLLPQVLQTFYRYSISSLSILASPQMPTTYHNLPLPSPQSLSLECCATTTGPWRGRGSSWTSYLLGTQTQICHSSCRTLNIWPIIHPVSLLSDQVK